MAKKEHIKVDRSDIFLDILEMGNFFEKPTKEIYNMRLNLYNSYFKSIITLILGAGLGVFLILIFSAVMLVSESYNQTLSFFLLYVALIEILFLFIFIRRLYKRHLLRMIKLLKTQTQKSKENHEILS